MKRNGMKLVTRFHLETEDGYNRDGEQYETEEQARAAMRRTCLTWRWKSCKIVKTEEWVIDMKSERFSILPFNFMEHVDKPMDEEEKKEWANKFFSEV